MTDEELQVSNEFTTFVRIQLDHEQKQQLNRLLNLHYLEQRVYGEDEE